MADNPKQEFARLDEWARSLLQSFSPRERKSLLVRMGRELRRTNKKRLTRQTAPDGTPWPKRKPQPSPKGEKRKRAKMFLGLRKNRHMQLRVTTNTLELGFSGRTGQIARIHHQGLRERLKARQRGKPGPLVKFAARQLIGLSENDRHMLNDLLIDHVEAAGNKGTST